MVTFQTQSFQYSKEIVLEITKTSNGLRSRQIILYIVRDSKADRPILLSMPSCLAQDKVHTTKWHYIPDWQCNVIVLPSRQGAECLVEFIDCPLNHLQCHRCFVSHLPNASSQLPHHLDESSHEENGSILISTWPFSAYRCKTTHFRLQTYLWRQQSQVSQDVRCSLWSPLCDAVASNKKLHLCTCWYVPCNLKFYWVLFFV